MPPLQALVALHGLWALALVPPAVWAGRRWPPSRLRFTGYALTAAALLILIWLTGHELATWYRHVSPDEQKYLPQRMLYVLGTSTDLPVVQVFVAGIVLWFGAGRRERRYLSQRAASEAK
jgi:hypothetical protein